jgi:hypothetical protein
MPSSLPCGYKKFVGVNSKALNIISVAKIVSLRLLLYIIQNNYTCHKIHHFSCRKQIQIGTAVTTSIAIHPFKFQASLGCCGHFHHIIILSNGCGSMQDNWPPT